MKSFIVEGGKKLDGTIKVSGSKNASLPILAATILGNGTSKLYNIPNISDIDNTIRILKLLGAKAKKGKNRIEINTQNINKTEIPAELMSKMRSSIILAGAILGRFKKVKFSYPGGCDIGARPIDLHINAFRRLGVEVREEQGYIVCEANRISGNSITLDFPSVGATENIILAACTADGETTINNAAMEPEISDLICFLNKMGAKIEGEGTSRIRVKGVKKLRGSNYNVMPDRIEAGTFLCAAAGTGGNIILKNANPSHMEAILGKLEECGCNIERRNNYIRLDSPRKLKAIEIKTTTYPGFPTDLQQIFAAMLLKSSGTSVIKENIFESRYKYIAELRKINNKIIQDGRITIITGKRKIQSASMECTDLRGGAAIVIAALMAKGTSRISNIEHILRGYENFDIKLNLLGAKIRASEE